ncbi:hypothetical protein Tco_0125124, partial [Tanacetum coccineum]
MKDEGLKRQRMNSSNDDKISEDLLKEGNKNNIDDLLKRIKTTQTSPEVNIRMKLHLKLCNSTKDPQVENHQIFLQKSNSQLNDKGFVDSGCLRHMTGNIAHLSVSKTLMEVMLLLVEEHMVAEFLAK